MEETPCSDRSLTSDDPLMIYRLPSEEWSGKACWAVHWLLHKLVARPWRDLLAFPSTNPIQSIPIGLSSRLSILSHSSTSLDYFIYFHYPPPWKGCKGHLYIEWRGTRSVGAVGFQFPAALPCLVFHPYSLRMINWHRNDFRFPNSIHPFPLHSPLLSLSIREFSLERS